jgi:predicted helicase
VTAISPDKIVDDWGGFEKLVAKLHDTGSVKVQHDVKLKGQSGAIRQIDVPITHTEGLYEHLILVECKHWNSNVKRMQVDAMVTSVKDLKASRGVIFTTKDFQSGAVTAAEAFGVDLIKVREFAEAEWGLPGRRIDFLMQYFQRS